MLRNLFFVFGIIGVVSAGASEVDEFDGSALKLLSAVFNNCPIEFIQAMKGADKVGSASFTSDRPGETYEITTVSGGGFGPSGPSPEVATLRIIRKRIRVSGPQPTDKKPQFKVTCELTSAQD